MRRAHILMTMTLSMLAFAALALLPAVSRAAEVLAGPPSWSTPAGQGGWTFELGARQRAHFLAAVNSAPPAARAIVQRLEPATTVRLSTSCAPASCATADIVVEDGVRTARYELDLLPAHVNASRSSRFLMLHEVGHLVAYEFIDDADAAAFRSAFSRSSRWRDCYRHGSGCLPFDELFAEQFALYASGQARSLTSYGMPRLLPNRRFAALLAAAAA